MLNWRAIVVAVIACLLVVTSCDDLTEEQESQLRSFIDSVMTCRDNLGLSIALVRNDRAIFTEGFGVRHLELQEPMTSNTKINIGSLTKSFTATLAAQAVAQDLVKWNTPVSQVLGEGFALQDEFRTELASLRDLLAHRVGMPSYWGATTAAMNFTREELCMKYCRNL